MEPDAHETEVDGGALGAIIERFRAHHAYRIARTGERLIVRHRRVLDALPMLYHRNHPALPGYVGPDVPHGIAGYRPGDGAVRALRAVARGYVEPTLPPARADLHGIYLMGSGGTVGQTRGSDIDLWLCCNTLQHAALWPKVRMIDRWAADLGLELQTFLVDPDVLRTRGSLPGTRIPMLVLDEFYRTGALMAGRYPLWWLIADDDPQRYSAAAERLLGSRFVSRDAVVDFGPVTRLPAAELAQAAITELDRALATPHKSLLKLKLIEAYAQAPELGAVSTAYKARVHRGETDRLKLDPYLLLYEHVERHLRSQGRDDELTFARTLLIGKAAESITWQRESPEGTPGSLLERFLAWGFEHADVARFRNVDGWTMQERRLEHDRIMRALQGGLRLVEDLVRDAAAPEHEPEFAAEQASADATAEPEHQLQWLNETRLRQLRIALSRLEPLDPRAIGRLHPALVSRQKSLPLELDRGGDRWMVRERGVAVRGCTRLVEAVLWAALNGASLAPVKPASGLSRAMAQVLQGFRGERRALYAFVNAESDDQRVPPWSGAEADAPEAAGATLLSRHDDPLDYGAMHQMHLETLDLVSQDSHGHWRLDSLTDETSVLEGLGRLFVCPPTDVSWQVLGGRERFRLAQRLEQLHRLARAVLDAPGAMFVLPFGADTVTIRQCGGLVETRRHRTLDDLQRYVDSVGCISVGVDPVSQRLKGLLRAS